MLTGDEAIASISQLFENLEFVLAQAMMDWKRLTLFSLGW